MAIACSAVVTELPNGVFMTTTPRLRRGVDINVINPDPGAAHDFQIFGRVEQFGRNGRRRAYGQSIGISNCFSEFIVSQTGPEIDVDTPAHGRCSPLRGSVCRI